jgi:hypothetical protein
MAPPSYVKGEPVEVLSVPTIGQNNNAIAEEFSS